MKSISLAAGIGLLAIGAILGAAVAAQQTSGGSDVSELRKEIDALKARQLALEQQLAQLLAALSQARDPQPQQVPIRVGNAPMRGRADAKVTMVEFSDFQCPYCGKHVRETMPQIDREYIQTGKVRYVFRDFPIDSLHPQAAKAHEAVNCAGDQGKYWEMWERLFNNPRQLAPAELLEHGRAVGLDTAALKQCLDTGRHTAAVNASVQEAVNLGATGTPVIFFGLTEPGSDTVKAVRVIRGAYPFERFKQVIEALLTQ